INSEKLYWFDKVKPLASHIRNISKQIYVSGSRVAIDEMMIRFSGHSKHAFRMKNKPVSEGYKIISLCEKGYTYTFMFESRVELNKEVPNILGLSKTGSLVSYLVTQLSNSRTYDIYMDNYFASIPLFNYLQSKDTLAEVVVNNVLVIFWMNNGFVHMLSTIHGIKGNKWKVLSVQRRPRETSSNAANVQKVFGDKVYKEIVIPKAINNYNYFMNGADIADQYRSYYNCQLAASCTWMLLLFWLIDTAI
ncbi:296_t:CDS:2, partial [Dentiscutata erythropus]